MLALRRDALPVDLGDGLFILSLGDARDPAACTHNGIPVPPGLRTVRVMGDYVFLCEVLPNGDLSVSTLSGFDAARVDWARARHVATARSLVTLWITVANVVLARDAEDNEEDGDGDGKANEVFLASGAERFGLYEPTVIYHLLKMPGADTLPGVRARDFGDDAMLEHELEHVTMNGNGNGNGHGHRKVKREEEEEEREEGGGGGKRVRQRAGGGGVVFTAMMRALDDYLATDRERERERERDEEVERGGEDEEDEGEREFQGAVEMSIPQAFIDNRANAQRRAAAKKAAAAAAAAGSDA